LTAALGAQDGRQFGVIEVATSLGCHECMLYRDEIVKAINSIPGWKAQSIVETTIRADVVGFIIAVKDSKAILPRAHVIVDALKAAELPFTIGTAHYLSPDKVMLIVGSKP
jgi:hypothetical protein